MSARKERDDRLFEQLYRRHHGAVYGSLLRDLRSHAEAEDATQVTFLQAYRAVRRGGRPDRPRAWLLAIADNLRRRRFVRARARPPEVPLEVAGELPARETADIDDVRDALATLPLNQRAAFVLREVGGLSYAEIARKLGVTVHSVQMLLFRARKTLRTELGETSRRASSWIPGWLASVLGHADRFGPAARLGGVAVAAALATTIAVGGAAPPSPPPRGVPVARDATEPRTSFVNRDDAAAPTRVARRTPVRGERSGPRAAAAASAAPQPVTERTPVVLEHATRPEPVLRLPAPPALPAPELSLPAPPALLPLPPLPAPVPVRLPLDPVPPLPLP